MQTVLVLLSMILIALGATQAFAKNCADRQQVCFRYCDKTYQLRGHEACRATCGDYMSICRSTGCWESKVTAKECGFTKN